MKDTGFIKIHRKILEWEWYDDVNTKVLFLHIILKANWEDKKWHGIIIKRGELLTGRKILATETQLTEQQVRTSLNKLKSTNEITIKTTKKYSIIKAINYDDYQSQTTNSITNKQPTNNQQITTTKELKELKELKEYKNINILNTEEASIEEKELKEKKQKNKKEVDDLQELIKQEVNKTGLTYKRGNYERDRIKNMLTGKEFGEISQRVGMTRQEFAINIFKISLKLDFWNGKIYNANTIYKHYAQVYNQALKLKSEIEVKENRKIKTI